MTDTASSERVGRVEGLTCLVSSPSGPAASQHVRFSELHRHVSDDWLLRLVCRHLSWSQGELKRLRGSKRNMVFLK